MAQLRNISGQISFDTNDADKDNRLVGEALDNLLDAERFLRAAKQLIDPSKFSGETNDSFLWRLDELLSGMTRCKQNTARASTKINQVKQAYIDADNSWRLSRK